MISIKGLNKDYFKLMLGFIFSALTAPLLTSVDTAVVGQLSNPAFIGGVALGGTVFNTMYWLLGFLRVSTSGYSAKAYGLQNEKEEMFALIRPTTVAIVLGMLFWIIQTPLLKAAASFYKTSAEIIYYMEVYYRILIWGAPFVLLNYTFLGWIMGRRQLKECLILQLTTNFTNILLDFFFVRGLNMNVEGVAYATLIAQVTTTILSICIILKGKKSDSFSIRNAIKKMKVKEVFEGKAMKEIGAVNFDLVIRTVCLLTVTNLFMEESALNGKIILAANSILFQTQYLMASFFDGTANASSVFTGNAIGEKNKSKIEWTIKKSFQMCGIISVILCIILVLLEKRLVRLYTNNTEVIEIAGNYIVWMMIYPLIINAGLIFYGVFSGVTYISPVRNSMLLSLGIFIMFYMTVAKLWGNHGLWFSFIMFSAGRSVFLIMYIPKLRKRIYNEIEGILK